GPPEQAAKPLQVLGQLHLQAPPHHRLLHPLPVGAGVFPPPALLLGHHLGPHGVWGVQDFLLPVGPVREPERLIQSLTGTDPPSVDPEREVIGHVGKPAPFLVDLEDHDAILVDRACPFPVHAPPPHWPASSGWTTEGHMWRGRGVPLTLQGGPYVTPTHNIQPAVKG